MNTNFIKSFPHLKNLQKKKGENLHITMLPPTTIFRILIKKKKKKRKKKYKTKIKNKNKK